MWTAEGMGGNAVSAKARGKAVWGVCEVKKSKATSVAGVRKRGDDNMCVGVTMAGRIL